MAYTKWDFKRFDDVLKLINGETVLDVGFGSGEMLRRLSSARYKATGADKNIGNIQEIPDGVKIFKMDVRDLEFEDDSFDTVIAMEVLEHNPEEDNEKMISELQRVAKQVLITVPFNEPEPLWRGHKQSFSLAKINRLFPDAKMWKIPRGKGIPWIGIEL